MTMRFRLLLGTLALLGAPVLATTASAQIHVPGPISTADGKSSKPQGRKPVEPPPAAIPGSRADTSLSGPAAANGVDMPPNEALFDAINRGDFNGTKEAIGRGADIHARNVLGLTPLELSVDLGRNNISFLLLSLRGGAGYEGTRSAAASAPVHTPTAAERRAERQAEAQARRQAAAEARNLPREPAPRRSPALFAGDGGAPVPQAGFLGFSATR